jgi:hypothetical protein
LFCDPYFLGVSCSRGSSQPDENTWCRQKVNRRSVVRVTEFITASLCVLGKVDENVTVMMPSNHPGPQWVLEINCTGRRTRDQSKPLTGTIVGTSRLLKKCAQHGVFSLCICYYLKILQCIKCMHQVSYKTQSCGESLCPNFSPEEAESAGGCGESTSTPPPRTATCSSLCSGRSS